MKNKRVCEKVFFSEKSIFSWTIIKMKIPNDETFGKLQDGTRVNIVSTLRVGTKVQFEVIREEDDERVYVPNNSLIVSDQRYMIFGLSVDTEFNGEVVWGVEALENGRIRVVMSSRSPYKGIEYNVELEHLSSI